MNATITMNQSLESFLKSKGTTKRVLVEYLKKLADNVPEGEISERIDYAIKMSGKEPHKVTREDLEELIREASVYVEGPESEEEVEPVVETSPKPTKKLGKKSPTKKTAEPAESAKTKEPEVKKNTPKKKSTGEVIEAVVSPSCPPLAVMFPDEIENDEIGTLVACKDKYTTYEELYEALENGKTLYFACYWTPRLIKEYSYGLSRMVKQPKSFPHNLDLLLAIAPCETMKRVHCMSQYTEAMFMFEDSDFEYVEEVVGDTTYRLRVSSGLEFEIYEPMEENDSEE